MYALFFLYHVHWDLLIFSNLFVETIILNYINLFCIIVAHTLGEIGNDNFKCNGDGVVDTV